MDNPWITRVKCQGPRCTKETNVARPGEVRAGWLVLRVELYVKGDSQNPDCQILPFCGLNCLYNWAKARIPSKRGKGE